MRKVLCLLLCLICVTCLVGCSSTEEKLTLKADGFAIYNGSTTLDVTEHRGYSATKKAEGLYVIEYYLCPSIEECGHNTIGVKVEDMTSYKDGTYYTAYLDSQICYYHPYKEQVLECYCTIYEDGALSVNQALEFMYKEAQSLALEENVELVQFNNVDLKVAGFDFKVRPTEVLIPGLVKVYQDNGAITAEETQIMQDKLIGYYGTANYDYYQWNGTLVQAAKGTSVGDYVTFKE